jgi:hypothetical protein
VGPTPFGSQFLIFVQEAVFIEKDHLPFLKGVQVGGRIGTVGGLGAGGLVVLQKLSLALGHLRLSRHKTCMEGQCQ